MKLFFIIGDGLLLEGASSRVLVDTMSNRLDSLKRPASILNIDPNILVKLLDDVILNHDLRKYIPDSFWDRLASMAGQSMNKGSIFRKCFDRAISNRPGKLRYLMGFKYSYDKFFDTFMDEHDVNHEMVLHYKSIYDRNVLLFDMFIYLFETYNPNL